MIGTDDRVGVLDRLAAAVRGERVDITPLLAESWRSPAMGAFAVAMWPVIAPSAATGHTRAMGDDVTVDVVDGRGRGFELWVRFAPGSTCIANMGLVPRAAEGVVVRELTHHDLPAITGLERSAPVARADGTQVTIEYGPALFDREPLLEDHVLLGAWIGDELVATQGVNVYDTTIAGNQVRVAHNHFSRSDPRHRRSGNQLHLVMRLYFDVFARIDYFYSYVDPQNGAGVRLSFGRPWSSRVSRVLFSCDRLRAAPADVPLITPDIGRAAALCTTTHGGNALWTSTTEASQRVAAIRAPSVLGESRWLTSANAASAMWASGERRRSASAERTHAVIAAYGFAGDSGPTELLALLATWVRRPEIGDATHIALFCADDDPRTAWLAGHADEVEPYLVCGEPLPDLAGHGVFCDAVRF